MTRDLGTEAELKELRDSKKQQAQPVPVATPAKSDDPAPDFLSWVPTATTTRVLTATTDGKEVSIAPPDKGAWYERWWDETLWTDGSGEPLTSGDKRSRATAWTESKALDDALSQLVDQNVTIAANNDKLRTSAKGKEPRCAPTGFAVDMHMAYLAPRGYAKAVDDENDRIDTDNAKLPSERQLTKLSKPTAAPSPLQELRRKGQHETQFVQKIPDDYAKQIKDFREKALASTKVPRVVLGWEPDARYRFVGNRIDEINKLLTQWHGQNGGTPPLNKQREDARAALNSLAKNPKTKDTDLTKAQDKFDILDIQVKAYEKELDPLVVEQATAVADGTASTFTMVGKANTLTEPQLRDLLVRLGYTEMRVANAFLALAGNQGKGAPREGTPQTVISYDATLSVGAGFAPSVGGDGIFRNIAKPESAFNSADAAALYEMHTYLKKCGIYIGTKNYPHGTGRKLRLDLDIRVVHIEGSAGYVITNAPEVYTGLFKGAGQGHDVNIGAAYQYMRHSKVLQQALFSLGDHDTLPEQTTQDATKMMQALSALCAVGFFRLHAGGDNAITYARHIKSKALFIYLTHLSHWGPAIYVGDRIMRWVFARRLVPCTITFADSTTPSTKKAEVKQESKEQLDQRAKSKQGIPNQGASDSADEEQIDDIVSFQYTPSFESDVIIAKCAFAYSLEIAPKNSPAQLAQYWDQFISDLGDEGYKPDSLWNPETNPKIGLTTKFAFESLKDYTARTKLTCDDASMRTIADAEDSSADHYIVSTGLTNTSYVLAPIRVRDWQEAPAFADGDNAVHLRKFRSLIPSDSGTK